MEDTKIEFLYLSEEDMIEAGVLDAGKCVDTMGEVMTLLSEGDCMMGGRNRNNHGIQLMFPKKSDIKDFPLEDSRDRRFMSMPAYLGGRFHLAGEKWYGSNGRNTAKGLPRSILMVTLNDIETGQPLAYMSANLLSAMRTGAMPGLTAQYLARKDSKVISLIGPGAINKTCLMAYMAKFDSIETIKIKGSSAKSKTALDMKQFVEETYPQVKNVIVCDDLEEAVKDADIISEAVSVKDHQWPVFQPEWLKPGCVFISSGTMDMTDHNFMKDHMTKVVDNIHMYEEYIEVYEEYDADGNRKSSGTPGMYFVNMIEDGLIDKKEVYHLGDIVRGTAPGRTSDDQMFLVSLGGMPILDIGWGYECWQNALKKGIGTKLKLWDKPYLA
ncbi:MAG: tyramine oxidase subunit B [Butyribacter sp.]|nr:tyramine oxidase subunit B [bacterium]MDY3854627.1 tyramine oxidase subunit B [Butyribacter sp.]